MDKSNVLHIDLRGLQTISEHNIQLFTAWHFAQARPTMPCISSSYDLSVYNTTSCMHMAYLSICMCSQSYLRHVHVIHGDVSMEGIICTSCHFLLLKDSCTKPLSLSLSLSPSLSPSLPLSLSLSLSPSLSPSLPPSLSLSLPLSLSLFLF